MSTWDRRVRYGGCAARYSEPARRDSTRHGTLRTWWGWRRPTSGAPHKGACISQSCSLLESGSVADPGQRASPVCQCVCGGVPVRPPRSCAPAKKSTILLFPYLATWHSVHFTSNGRTTVLRVFHSSTIIVFITTSLIFLGYSSILSVSCLKNQCCLAMDRGCAFYFSCSS